MVVEVAQADPLWQEVSIWQLVIIGSSLVKQRKWNALQKEGRS